MCACTSTVSYGIVWQIYLPTKISYVKLVHVQFTFYPCSFNLQSLYRRDYYIGLERRNPPLVHWAHGMGSTSGNESIIWISYSGHQSDPMVRRKSYPKIENIKLVNSPGEKKNKEEE